MPVHEPYLLEPLICNKGERSPKGGAEAGHLGIWFDGEGTDREHKVGRRHKDQSPVDGTVLDTANTETGAQNICKKK